MADEELQKQEYDWENKVGARRFRLRPKSPLLAWFAGVLVSQIFGVASLALIVAVAFGFKWDTLGNISTWTASALAVGQVFLIPFMMGVVASYFWQREDGKSPDGGCGSTILNTLFSCIGSAVVLREGAICVLMASPLLGLFMFFGVNVGARFWHRTPFLRVSLVPLFLLSLYAMTLRPRVIDITTSTDFHSQANPSSLWKYAASYPYNSTPADWWLWKMGLPAPVKLQGQTKVGGRRDCWLTGGIFVGSRITGVKENHQLDFVIDQRPKHPEITNHLELLHGRIQLIPDAKGGTTIRGTSWYRLRVTPTSYFSLWSDAVVHHLHSRVFAWMDTLAQRDERAAHAAFKAATAQK